jgi:hypothetical protein
MAAGIWRNDIRSGAGRSIGGDEESGLIAPRMTATMGSR